jgi:hypothetical protein
MDILQRVFSSVFDLGDGDLSNSGQSGHRDENTPSLEKPKISRAADTGILQGEHNSEYAQEFQLQGDSFRHYREDRARRAILPKMEDVLLATRQKDSSSGYLATHSKMSSAADWLSSESKYSSTGLDDERYVIFRAHKRFSFL